MGRGWWSDKGGRKSECPKARSCHGTSQAEGSAQDAEVSRAQKVCWAIWGVSQHRARAPHATAAGGLRAIWPGCVAVRSKGPLSTEHAYIQVNKAPICDVRRTLSMCTVYFLVRVRMACQRLAAGIVHDDDACTARTRRHRDAPTGPGTSMLVKGDDQYDVHVAEHGGLVLPGMFLVRSVHSALDNGPRLRWCPRRRRLMGARGRRRSARCCGSSSRSTSTCESAADPLGAAPARLDERWM